jgi:hypothetical protein
MKKKDINLIQQVCKIVTDGLKKADELNAHLHQDGTYRTYPIDNGQVDSHGDIILPGAFTKSMNMSEKTNRLANDKLNNPTKYAHLKKKAEKPFDYTMRIRFNNEALNDVIINKDGSTTVNDNTEDIDYIEVKDDE